MAAQHDSAIGSARGVESELCLMKINGQAEADSLLLVDVEGWLRFRLLKLDAWAVLIVLCHLLFVWGEHGRKSHKLS